MRWMLGAAVSVLMGCASAPSQAPVVANRADPWEGWNRKVYAFNDRLDTAVLKPVAASYIKVVPQPVRTGVNNFYGNFTDAWSAVNNLLQGKLGNSLQDIARVSTNVVLGLTVFDVATELGLDRQDEDFGQTLGRWGVKPGPYMVLPLFGPSTLRDTAALPLDRALSPTLLVDGGWSQAGVVSLGLVNTRANLFDVTRMLDDMALDKYSFVRDAYLQRRRSLIYDGNEPAPADEATGVEVAPVAAPEPASAASQPK